jgi:hypothetical protein
MLEFMVVLAVAGGAWWWRAARKRTIQVRDERDMFVAVAELRTLLRDHPHAEPLKLVDELAVLLLRHRQDMTPQEARDFALRAAHHVAVGSEAWSPTLPGEPERQRHALPPVPRPAEKPTDPNMQAFWVLVGLGVVFSAGYLLLAS